jgi:hypothetical protein
MAAQEAELSEQMKKGHYVLRYERPFIKERMKALLDRSVKQEFVVRGPEYTQLFYNLNMKPEVSERFVKHAEKIHRASLEASAAIQQLAFARDEFAHGLKQEVSQEDWSRFENFEASRQVNHESELIKKYLWEQRGTSIDSAGEETLKQLLRETQAYTDKLGPNGPLDGLPNIVVGQEGVLREVQRDIQQLTEQSSQLLDGAREAGLGAEQIEALAAYYQSKLEALDRTVERTKNLHIHETAEEMAQLRR